MFFPHGAVGSNQRGLDVAERGVDPFESRRLGGRAPEPVMIAVCVQPASTTAVKHFKPSETISAPLESAVLASLRSATLLNAFTRRRMI